jgi:hypothetical protein
LQAIEVPRRALKKELATIKGQLTTIMEKSTET